MVRNPLQSLGRVPLGPLCGTGCGVVTGRSTRADANFTVLPLGAEVVSVEPSEEDALVVRAEKK